MDSDITNTEGLSNIFRNFKYSPFPSALNSAQDLGRKYVESETIRAIVVFAVKHYLD